MRKWARVTKVAVADGDLLPKPIDHFSIFPSPMFDLLLSLAFFPCLDDGSVKPILPSSSLFLIFDLVASWLVC